MIKVTLTILMLFSISISSFAKSKVTDWGYLKDKNVVSYVEVFNHSYKETIGAPEFLAKAEFIPYNSKGEALDTVIELSYGSPLPKTILIGKTYYFTHVVPFSYFFESTHFDIRQVAYFEIQYRVVEDDFLLKQKAINFKLRLTPQGFVGYVKKTKKHALRDRVTIQTSKTQSLSASGEVFLD